MYRVTGGRCYSRDLAQGRMEIPCALVFQGNNFLTSTAKKMLKLCKQKPEKDKATAQATQQEARQEAISSGDGDSQTKKLNLKLKVHHQPAITCSTGV